MKVNLSAEKEMHKNEGNTFKIDYLLFIVYNIPFDTHVYLHRVDVHIQNELKFWQAMVEENYSFKSRLKEIQFLEDY